MKRISVFFLISLFMYTNSTAIAAVQGFNDNVDIIIGGELRPRTEVNNKGLDNSSNPNYFTTMRSRLNVNIKAGNSIKAFFQLQDVRAWGEETSTLNDYDADGFDLHQGYIDLLTPFNMPFNLRVGRQEIILDGHRLVGNVNWTQRARAFDAVKIMMDIEPININLFASKIKEGTGAGDTIDDAITVSGDSNEDWNQRDNNFYGLWAKLGINDKTGLSAYMLYQDMENTINNADNGVDRYTAGLRLAGAVGGLKFRGEGYYQFGNNADKKIQAYMFGIRLGYACDVSSKPNLTLWYDYLSGDKDTTDNNVKSFDTLYATNHKFYGFMDYFLNIPSHTKNKGLQDIALKFSFNPAKKVKVAADLHHFLLAESSTVHDNKKELGQEFDLTVKWKYHKLLTISSGYSVFLNSQMARVSLGSNNAHWGYVMMDLKF